MSDRGTSSSSNIFCILLCLILYVTGCLIYQQYYRKDFKCFIYLQCFIKIFLYLDIKYRIKCVFVIYSILASLHFPHFKNIEAFLFVKEHQLLRGKILPAGILNHNKSPGNKKKSTQRTIYCSPAQGSLIRVKSRNIKNIPILSLGIFYSVHTSISGYE